MEIRVATIKCGNPCASRVLVTYENGGLRLLEVHDSNFDQVSLPE